MNCDRKYAFFAGILFIIATVAGILGVSFLGPVLNASDYLAKMSANVNQVTMAALFILIMAMACSGIAVAMYPVIKRYYPALALGSVCFRLIEGVFHIVGVIILLTLLTLSQEFVKSGEPAASHFQTLGAVLMAGRNLAFNAAAILTWCVGALMYYWIFYQTKLVPRWLSLWGLLGIALSIIASILLVFQIVTDKSMLHTLLNVPIGLQEMVLAVWLIVKGFNPVAISSETSNKKLSVSSES